MTSKISEYERMNLINEKETLADCKYAAKCAVSALYREIAELQAEIDRLKFEASQPVRAVVNPRCLSQIVGGASRNQTTKYYKQLVALGYVTRESSIKESYKYIPTPAAYDAELVFQIVGDTIHWNHTVYDVLDVKSD